MYRRAFTLVELVIAIAITAFLAAMGVGVLYRISKSNRLHTGMDRLSAAIVFARNVSKREETPTGMQIEKLGAKHVQRPWPISYGRYKGGTENVATFSGIDFTAEKIESGSYLQFHGWDTREVISSTPTTLTLRATRDLPPKNTPFQVYPNVRVMHFWEEVTFPPGVEVDLERSKGLDKDGRFLFGETVRQVIIWVTDGRKSVLISVHPRTGLVSSHDAADGDDPYLYAREDAEKSGL